MSFAPKIPDYPAGLGISRAVVSYCGPARWEIEERLAKQRRDHARYMLRARSARIGGTPAAVARALDNAAWCRHMIRSLLGSRRALDTMWADGVSMPYDEYEARRIALIKAGVIRP